MVCKKNLLKSSTAAKSESQKAFLTAGQTFDRDYQVGEKPFSDKRTKFYKEPGATVSDIAKVDP